MTRWIGFDMDECIGSLMPLYSLVIHIKNTAEKDALQKLLFISECEHRTWFLRPCLLAVLGHLHKAYMKKQIQGAFILSNNGSDDLVQFVGDFLNYCMWELYDNRGVKSNVFQMACSANTPARKPFKFIKNFAVVQLCLAAHGLPTCTKESDLLFFDDSDHVMSQEITNYVKVPAYWFQTEINQYLDFIQPMEKFFSNKEWLQIVNQTRQLYKEEYMKPDNPYKPYRQSLDDMVRDFRIFQNAFTIFLKKKQTRKNKGRHELSI